MTKKYIVKQLHLDSQNTSPSGNINSPHYNLESPIHGVKGIKILNCLIPTTFYNINSNNNSFTLYQNVATTTSSSTITLTQGNYSSSSFSTMLNSVLPANYTSTISSTNGRLTVNSNSANTFFFDFSNSGAFDVLGYPSTYSGSLATSQTGSKSINLGGCNNLYIRSTNLNSLDSIILGTGNSGFAVLAKVSNDQSLGTFISKDFNNTDFLALDQTLTSFGMSVVNGDYLNNIDFNGSSFSLTIALLCEIDI